MVQLAANQSHVDRAAGARQTVAARPPMLEELHVLSEPGPELEGHIGSLIAQPDYQPFVARRLECEDRGSQQGSRTSTDGVLGPRPRTHAIRDGGGHARTRKDHATDTFRSRATPASVRSCAQHLDDHVTQSQPENCRSVQWSS